jgi:hypothetical protein
LSIVHYAKLSIEKCPIIHSVKLINILIPDTVEAYESGELAKLLGIAVEDKDDL